jgi:hypothetical protein
MRLLERVQVRLCPIGLIGEAVRTILFGDAFFFFFVLWIHYSLHLLWTNAQQRVGRTPDMRVFAYPKTPACRGDLRSSCTGKGRHELGHA